MVFPGKRSSGCFNCRKRKVKCDGAKPQCQKCLSRDTQCPGYPDNYAFRDYQSAPRDRQRLAPGSGLIPAPLETDDGTTFPTSQTLSSPISSPVSNPTLNLEWQSICYFTHHYVLQVHHSPCRGSLAFFPELYREYADGTKSKTIGGSSCLKHAILGVTLLALFNASRVGELYVNARRHYGLAMRDMGYVLRGSEQGAVSGDEVLGAVLFLCLFADLSGETDNAPNNLNPHIPGASSLLHLRNGSQLSTKYGPDLFGWAIVQIQTQSIFHHHFQYGTVPPSIRTMYKPDNVYRAGIILDMLAGLCQSIDDTRAGLMLSSSFSNEQKEPIHRILIRSHYIIEEIDTWEDSVPEHWKYQYHIDNNDNIDPGTEGGEKRDEWTTPYLATIYSSQITFFMVLLDFWDYILSLGISLKPMHPHPHPHPLHPKHHHHPHHHGHKGPHRRHGPGPFIQPSDLEARTRRLLEIIYSTVTACLGTVDAGGRFQPVQNAKQASGWALRIPMRSVLGCRFATEEQVRVCQGGLEFMNCNIGRECAQ